MATAVLSPSEQHIRWTIPMPLPAAPFASEPVGITTLYTVGSIVVKTLGSIVVMNSG